MAGRRLVVAGLIALASAIGALAAVSGRAVALSAPTPWTGVNPFNCQIQNARFGTTTRQRGTAVPGCRASVSPA